MPAPLALSAPGGPIPHAVATLAVGSLPPRSPAAVPLGPTSSNPRNATPNLPPNQGLHPGSAPPTTLQKSQVMWDSQALYIHDPAGLIRSLTPRESTSASPANMQGPDRAAGTVTPNGAQGVIPTDLQNVNSVVATAVSAATRGDKPVVLEQNHGAVNPAIFPPSRLNGDVPVFQ